MPGNAAQIHHVGIALLAGVAAVILGAGRRTAEPGQEAGILRRGGQRLRAEFLIGVQQSLYLRQVGDGQRGAVLRLHRLAALVIGVADHLAQRRAVHGRIVRQRLYPLGVVPAVGRLRLLGGHQIVAQVAEGVGRVHGGHQAGVKAHQLQRRSLGVRLPHGGEGLVHLAQGQGVVVVQLVEGRAGHGAAAVVPEHHRRSVGGIVLPGEAQELLQRLAVAHAGGGLLVHEGQTLAVVDVALQQAAVYDLVLPLCRAACLDDHGDVLRQRHLQQLVEIAGGEAALALQITAAQIPVYRPAAVPAGGGRLVAAGGERQRHHQRQQQSTQSFHFIHPQIPNSCFFLAANSSSVRTPASSSALYFWISATVSTGAADCCTAATAAAAAAAATEALSAEAAEA